MVIEEIHKLKEFYEQAVLESTLPPILRWILPHVDDARMGGTMLALMPILATYSNRVRHHYVYDDEDSNKLTAPTVQCYAVAQSGDGKGKVEFFQNLLAKKLLDMDFEERCVENSYNKKRNARAGNQKIEEAPNVVTIVLAEVITVFMVVERGLNICERYGQDETLLQYHFSAELKSILDSSKNASCDLGYIMLKAYDLGSKVGRETGNKESKKGLVDVNISSLYLTTSSVLNEFFRNKLTDGTLNRAIIIPFENDCGFKHEIKPGISDHEKLKINAFLDIMMANIFDADGNMMPINILDTKFLDKHVLEYNNYIFDLRNSSSCTMPATIKEFQNRSSTSAFRVACICYYLYKLEQQQADREVYLSDQEIEDNVVNIYCFAVYYILYNTLDLFGMDHNKIVEKERAKRRERKAFCRITLYNSLPRKFSFLKLTEEMSDREMITMPKKRISQWKSLNMIVEVAPGIYEKLPERMHVKDADKTD